MAEDRSRPDKAGILHPEGMRAARHLAAGVVHEVNNILGVIIGNAHLANKSLSDPAQVERYIREVRDAADEGRELMEQLAFVAGRHPGRPRVLSLNELVRNAVAGLKASLDLELSAADPTVALDPWLGQVALGSVARFMDQTESVATIRITTRVVGATAELAIEDDGASLSEGERELLFAPFAKPSRRPKPGVALTRLADLAARFGGDLEAQSCSPKGLRIVLTLPISREVGSVDGPGVALPKKRV